MQPPLGANVDELAAPAKAADRCGIWGCNNARQAEQDYCIAHTTPPAQRSCPICIDQGRGRGAVFMASGVPVCGICGWGRSRVPKANKGRNRAAAGRRK